MTGCAGSGVRGVPGFSQQPLGAYCPQWVETQVGSLPPCSWGLATEETGWPLHLLHAELPLSWAPSPEGIVQSRCTPVRAPRALGRGADPRLSCRSRRARREMGGPVGDSAATAKDHSALIGGLLAWPGVLRAGALPRGRESLAVPEAPSTSARFHASSGGRFGCPFQKAQGHLAPRLL